MNQPSEVLISKVEMALAQEGFRSGLKPEAALNLTSLMGYLIVTSIIEMLMHMLHILIYGIIRDIERLGSLPDEKLQPLRSNLVICVKENHVVGSLPDKPKLPGMLKYVSVVRDE